MPPPVKRTPVRCPGHIIQCVWLGIIRPSTAGVLDGLYACLEPVTEVSIAVVYGSVAWLHGRGRAGSRRGRRRRPSPRSKGRGICFDRETFDYAPYRTESVKALEEYLPK